VARGYIEAAHPVKHDASGRKRAGVIECKILIFWHSYTYTVFMKNITLSIDEKILATVRRYAAENHSSVNGLVREFLTGIAQYENRARKARQRIRELSDQSPARIGKKSWKRDELHER